MSRIAELVGKADELAITTVSDNTVNALGGDGRSFERLQGGFMAEHGFSLLVEVKAGSSTRRFLLDTGQGSVLRHNMEEMKIDARGIDGVVISHGHGDHTGGLVPFLKLAGHRLPVVAHPDVFNPSIWVGRPGFVRRPFLPVLKDEVEESGGSLLLTRNPCPLFSGVLTTGEVERKIHFENLDGVLYFSNGELVESPIRDDQAIIVVLKDKGIAVLSGCGHSGIVNTVEQARILTGVERICCIIGGFHLEGAPDNRIDQTVEYLRELDAEVVSPTHCSGSKFTCKAAEALPDSFVWNGVGTRIRL